MNTAKTQNWRSLVALFALAGCLLAIPLLALAQSASADMGFCPEGTGAGQCSTANGAPGGVAVDTESGRVFVGDWTNHRVSVFQADGTFIRAFGWGVDSGASQLEVCTTASGCQVGLAGAGAGQFSAPKWLAVDNTGGPNQGDLYITDAGNYRVQRFDPEGNLLATIGTEGTGECQFLSPADPIAVGPGGVLYVADTPNAYGASSGPFRIQRFSPTGTCLGVVKLYDGISNQQAMGFAVDAAGNAFLVVGGGAGVINKFDPAGNLLEALPDSNTSHDIELDGDGNLYASQAEADYQVITAYDPAGEITSRFGYGLIPAAPTGSIGVLHGPSGDVFLSVKEKSGLLNVGSVVRYLLAPPLGPIVAPSSLLASPLSNTKATLKAKINPEGKATTYHFEYLTEAEYQTSGESFSGAASTAATALDFSAGNEFHLRDAEAVIGCPVPTPQLIAEGKCLRPETEYRFRVIATNPDNPSGTGEGTVEGSFTTKPSIELTDLYATDVGTDVATLHAEVNPLGIAATGHFEYVTEAQYQASGFAGAARYPAEADLDLGSLETPTTHSATLSPLPAGNSYRYRFVANNAVLSAPLPSEEKAFRTFPLADQPDLCLANQLFRTGPAALLPDCRAYEMVSPLDKENGDIVVRFQGAAGQQPAVLNQASLDGDRLTYGSYRAFGDAESAPFTSQYIAARDPEVGWLTHGIAPPGERKITGSLDFEFEYRAFSDDLCQAWITPQFEPVLAEGGVPGFRNLYRRDDELCGEEDFAAFSAAAPTNLKKETPEYLLELQGFSQDLSVAIFAANDSLTGSGAPLKKDVIMPRLYVSSDGGPPRFVCILPNGSKVNSCSAGTHDGPVMEASIGYMREARVTGALSADGKQVFWSEGMKEGKIYLRRNPLAEGPECAEPASPCTVAVSKVGEEQSGTAASDFWAAARDGSVVIYSTGKLGLTDKGADLYRYQVEGAQTEKIAGGVRGVLGQSEDLSRVYFASTEVLTGAEENSEGASAVDGEPNLYLYDADSDTYTFVGVLTPPDVRAEAGVSSATNPVPNFHNGRVSPDGAHAAFMSTAPLTGYDNLDATSGKANTEVFVYDAAAGGTGEIRCISCNPSGARPAGVNVQSQTNPVWVAARLPDYSTTLHAPRVLADDGSRLFFESQDSLVPHDTNSRFDVYQWERVGAGGCEETDATFSAPAGGCVDLISSGKSTLDTGFVDASPTGEDVFISTISSLVPSDYGLRDIYDARVGGGFSSPPAPAAECEGEACQPPPAAPDDPTPASSTYRGAGNLGAATTKPKRCKKGKVRRKGKCVRKKKAGLGKRRLRNSDQRASR